MLYRLDLSNSSVQNWGLGMWLDHKGSDQDLCIIWKARERRSGRAEGSGYLGFYPVTVLFPTLTPASLALLTAWNKLFCPNSDLLHHSPETRQQLKTFVNSEVYFPQVFLTAMQSWLREGRDSHPMWEWMAARADLQGNSVSSSSPTLSLFPLL